MGGNWGADFNEEDNNPANKAVRGNKAARSTARNRKLNPASQLSSVYGKHSKKVDHSASNMSSASEALLPSSSIEISVNGAVCNNEI